MPHAGIKGGGVDCVHLTASIYIAAGLQIIFNPPHYTMDGGFHSAKSQLLEQIEQLPLFNCIWRVLETFPTLNIGDLLLMRIGKVIHHCGIVISNEMFIHAISDRGVIESHLQDATFRKRIKVIFRPS